MLTMGHIRGSHNMRTVGFVSIALLSFLLLGIVFPASSKIEKTEAAPSYTAPTLDYTSTNNTAVVSLAITDTSGTFATSSSQESASFSISTNNTTGYTVNLKTSGTDYELSNNANTIDNISSIKTSSNFTLNSWGLLPSKYNSENNTTNYYPASSTGFTMNVTNCANGTPSSACANEADNYTVGLGVKADYSIPAGTYTNNTIIVEYVANPVSYSISYDKNVPVAEESTVTNMPASQSGTGSSQYIALSSTIPMRPHYSFLGWCDGDITTTNHEITDATIDTCTGTSSSTGITATAYQPGDSFYFNAITSNTVTLFAMWEERYYMQDFTPEMCTSMAENTNLVLYDNRDETEYKIGKLVDESCWLLDNLALDLTDSTVQANLSSANTNASDISLGYLKGTTSRNPATDPDGNYATSGVSEEWNDSYSYSDPLIKMDYVDTLVTGYGPASTNGKSKVGGYYNFCATSAGSYCYGNGTNQGVGIGDVTEDICPSGWRLPTGDPITGEYWQLCSTINGSACKSGDGDSNSMTATSPTSFQYQLSTPLAGSFLSGQVDRQDVVGRYWSSTKYSDGGMRYVFIDGQDVGPQSIGSHNVRNWGFTIRCVLKYPYMQDQTPTTMSEFLPNDGDTTIFADKRDGKKYSVTKIDEEYWMTRNLNLAGETPLYSSTSNVPAGYDGAPYYTLPTSSTNGFSDNATAYIYNSYNTNCTGDTPCYSYYSYPAATASTNPANGEAEYDICPKGWRLPTITNFQDLINRYPTVNDITSGPWNGNFTARYDQGIFGLYDHGRYWSSTATEVNSTYVNAGFLAYDTVINSLDTRFDRKHLGFAIRCVFKFPYMQDQTEAAMATVLPNIGDTTILADKRDNTKYMVGRLADDNYWMLKNLALDLTATHLTTLQGNTNASDSTLNYLKNGGGTGQYPASGVTTTWTNSYETPIINTNSKYTLVTAYGPSATNNNQEEIGIYYNYCSASAGSYCYSYGGGVGDAMEDICPTNWRLPTGKPATGEYGQLCNMVKGSNCTAVVADLENMNLQSSGSLQYQLSTPLSGRYYDNQNDSQGATGYFWSSNISEGHTMFRLSTTTSTISPQGTNSRYFGFSVRCILKSPIMQDQTATDMATLLPNNGDSIKMEDKRDHSKYQVAKISGDYWMTQNLRIAGTISSQDSNFTGSEINISQEDLEKDATGNSFCLNGAPSSCNSYTVPMTHISDDINQGVWYNFASASAGTIIGNSNTNNSTQDICPSGWHLPSGSNTTTGTDLNMLLGHTSTGWQTVPGLEELFKPVDGGYYYNGVIEYNNQGYWWSATSSNATDRYRLAYDSNNGKFTVSNIQRFFGRYVRCIRESRTILDIEYMQQITPSIAHNTSIGAIATLKDNRDEQSYTVGKLADGNIWMLDNLALDLTDATVQTKLTSTTTNASDTTLGYLKGTTSRDPSTDPNGNYATSGVSANWPTNTYSAPRIAINGLCVDSTKCVNDPSVGQWNKNGVATSWGVGSGKIGIYYNYCAASAGSYCYGNDANEGTTSGNATEDICPKGWRIPTGGADGEYQALSIAVTGISGDLNNDQSIALKQALSLLFSGYYGNNRSDNQNNTGAFWSTTKHSDNVFMHRLLVSNGIWLQNYGARNSGEAVRCIANN